MKKLSHFECMLIVFLLRKKDSTFKDIENIGQIKIMVFLVKKMPKRKEL
jgi:hypothetical protein